MSPCLVTKLLLRWQVLVVAAVLYFGRAFSLLPDSMAPVRDGLDSSLKAVLSNLDPVPVGGDVLLQVALGVTIVAMFWGLAEHISDIMNVLFTATVGAVFVIRAVYWSEHADFSVFDPVTNATTITSQPIIQFDPATNTTNVKVLLFLSVAKNATDPHNDWVFVVFMVLTLLGALFQVCLRKRRTCVYVYACIFECMYANTRLYLDFCSLAL
jgi:hypothetical protein